MTKVNSCSRISHKALLTLREVEKGLRKYYTKLWLWVVKFEGRLDWFPNSKRSF